ncbi:nicotinate-nucleotide pyrophosphorylase [carboxylating] isoform X1 [Gadus morhua]|uniref:Nicotinate-nucleotide pyrophosphorylase [carboxylating] n=2 Tax=Gadus morhua TaxID=8049 RepID=A0A8C5BI39_GADMO|nr:nicotinate-nucleotide pyrophosphorylase [carboxylating] isoform X1 [Gadus morhua]
MERDEKKLHGPVNGKFRFKQLPNGTVDKSIVICTICSKEFSYHRSSSSLKYHLNAKHLVASSQVRAASDPEAGASSQPRQTTLDQAFKHEMTDLSPETRDQESMVPLLHAVAAHAIPPQALTQLARDWLREDTPNFDPAGVCVGSGNVEARLFCKMAGSILAGGPFFTAVFAELGCTVNWLFPEAAEMGPDGITLVAEVRGPARCLLLGERPALNCLARASGIATRCVRLRAMAAAAGWHGEVAGTRKTTPGFRLVEKYAMLVGGASMHRQDLSGMAMLKDNHVWASGGITKAVQATRTVCGLTSKIEVECGSTEEACEAAAAGADIVMLDNLPPRELHAAALLLKQQFPALLVEASGGVSPENLPQYFGPHVDIISLGCITQGCPVVDFSLKVQKPSCDPRGPARGAVAAADRGLP